MKNFTLIFLVCFISCTNKKYYEVTTKDISKKFRIYKDFKKDEPNVFIILNDSSLFNVWNGNNSMGNPNFKQCLNEVAEGRGFVISNGTNVQILDVCFDAVKVKVLCCEPNINKTGWIEARNFIPIK
ncbi:MAG: hypothetical protein WCQ95_01410 [Bacteroidota bacterium]